MSDKISQKSPSGLTMLTCSRLLGVVFFILLLVITSKNLLAANYQTCTPSDSCTIGEFLYDDSYLPITTADCRLTSRYPNGEIFLNSEAMTASADGWYSYNMSIGTTEGIYRSQVCCTAATDYLCLDKTFEVKTDSSSLSASDIWSHSDRSLTSYGTLPQQVWEYSSRTATGYGTLVADIWGYNNKSLSNFGNLVSNIWNANSRTVTGGSTTSTLVATQENKINNLINITTETQALLEQLVNKPVVETFIDDNPTDLQTKLEKSNSTANSLYSSVKNLRSRIELLDTKWKELSLTEIQSELDNINKILKDDTFKENSSILSHTNWLKTSWDTPLTLNLSDQASAAQSKIENLKNDTNIFGKKDYLTFKSIITHIQNLDTLIGTPLNSSSDTTLFGYLKKITKLAETLDNHSNTAEKLLAEINSKKPEETNNSIVKLTSNILDINLINNPQTILSRPSKNNKNTPKNNLLSLIALITTNKNYLASNVGKTVGSVWLEEGSIIFRAVVTNPSKVISQETPIEIRLPEELQKENIIKSDPEITITYDTDKKQLVANGTIKLDPLETKTFLVETEDIWQFSESEINSLKNQANDLSTALINTTYYSQGLSLKSDIHVTLEKILSRQKEAITPESRIRSYRESRLELVGVAEKMNGLKNLISQTESGKNLFGFDKLQKTPILGLFLILLVCLSFIIIYTRALKTQPLEKTEEEIESDPKTIDHNLPKKHRHLSENHKKIKIKRLNLLTITLLLISGFGSLSSSLAARESKQPIELVSPVVSDINFQKNTLGASTSLKSITIPQGKNIPVYSKPDITSSSSISLKPGQNIFIYETKDGWQRVGFTTNDTEQNLWIISSL